MPQGIGAGENDVIIRAKVAGDGGRSGLEAQYHVSKWGCYHAMEDLVDHASMDTMADRGSWYCSLDVR